MYPLDVYVLPRGSRSVKSTQITVVGQFETQGQNRAAHMRYSIYRYAMWFMDYLASRLATRVQLTSDGHRAYLEAVEGAFGCDVDYAQLVKMYGNVSAPDNRRYSPAECAGIKNALLKASLIWRT
jgi:hypothetical protein